METSEGPAARAALASLVGRRVASASSDLTRFAVALDDGRGLLAVAVGDAAAQHVALTVGPADALPALQEAVCTVDWSWIVGATLEAATLAEGQLRFALEPAGPLAVSALLWQGAPFLAFQPYRAVG
jgi:hypothetical protein